MKKYLESFTTKKCSCGKTHTIKIPEIVTSKGAIQKLPEFITEFHAKKPFILADKNTFNAVGEKVLYVRDKANINYSKYVFSTGEVEPDEKAVGRTLFDRPVWVRESPTVLLRGAAK